jgi:hypothetical protein
MRCLAAVYIITTEQLAMMTLNTLAQYIAAHGFQATSNGVSVEFAIPCGNGFIVETVSTWQQAREALGY